MEDLSTKGKKTIRIGLMGLMDRNWIDTSELDISKFKLEKYVKIGRSVSKKLKEELKCDLVIAVTHMRNNDDMDLQDKDNNIDISKTLVPITFSEQIFQKSVFV